MRSLPELSEHEIIKSEIKANEIWQKIVLSMTQYTHDNFQPKFIPPDEMLSIIRPVAAAFTTLHYTPLPKINVIYKSKLYGLFYFTIICGVQIFIQQRSLAKLNAPFVVQKDIKKLRKVKEKIIKYLSEGIKVYPPVNTVMDIALLHIAQSYNLNHLNIKGTKLDTDKFNNFLPVTLMWGYLFAMSTILDI